LNVRGDNAARGKMQRHFFQRAALGWVVGQAGVIAFAADAVHFFREVYQLEIQRKCADHLGGHRQIQRVDPLQQVFFFGRIKMNPQLLRGAAHTIDGGHHLVTGVPTDHLTQQTN